MHLNLSIAWLYNVKPINKIFIAIFVISITRRVLI